MALARPGAFDDEGGSRARIAVLYALLIPANILAWAAAWWLFAGKPALLGTAFLAWMLGLRHAVDADHIAAIDNVVRKLMQDGRRPLAAGLYFSLGHSTVVVLAVVAIALTATAINDSYPAFKSVGGLIGTGVSAAFLLAIGLANLMILRSVWCTFSHVRSGGAIATDHPDLGLVGSGLLARICNPVLGAVTRSWHMYPLGFLFGLGFDTATEIGLLGISATQAAEGLPVWSILVFPALFTAGMALVDTTDSVLMVGAYGWAFVKPLRKLWYNLTITAASVAVALFIGSVEAIGLIADKLELQGAVWQAVAGLNASLASLGFVVVGLFVASWCISAAIWHWKRYDEIPVEVLRRRPLSHAPSSRPEPAR